MAAITQHYQDFAVKVPTDKTSPLRAARDKIGAHLDPDYREYWAKFDLPAMLGWINGSIAMFAVLIQPDLYHWQRGDETGDLLTTMSFDGREVTLKVVEGKPHSIVRTAVTHSPKEAIRDELLKLLAMIDAKMPSDPA